MKLMNHARGASASHCAALPVGTGKEWIQQEPHHSMGAALQAVGALSVSVSLLVMAGCATGTSLKPQLQDVVFTDIDGTSLKTQPTSLTTGQGVYVRVTLTDDKVLLGADWAAVCGSALAPGEPLPPGQTQDLSCGSFTPAHTVSGPIPSYVTNATNGRYVALYVAPGAPPQQGVVTLRAAATADSSRSSSATLTIQGEPIRVSFAPAPPSSIKTGASAQFKVALNNDTTNAGVRWSVICGSTDCGFFGPVQTTSGVATTYVAPSVIPAGGSVQVVATSIADLTKAVSATMSVTP